MSKHAYMKDPKNLSGINDKYLEEIKDLIGNETRGEQK